MFASSVAARTKVLVFTVLLALGFMLLGSVSAAAQGSHSATLNWMVSTDAGSSYNVYRIPGSCPSSAKTGDGTKLTSTPLVSGSTAYVDSGLAVGDYCYYVTAVLNGAESVPSNLAPAVVLPGAPSSLQVTVR